jgi:hypothetical protein
MSSALSTACAKAARAESVLPPMSRASRNGRIIAPFDVQLLDDVFFDDVSDLMCEHAGKLGLVLIFASAPRVTKM